MTTREGRLAWAFLRKYIFPGITGYVELGRLVGALTTAGFNVTELADDTLSDAWTVRVHVKPFVDWIWGGCALMALGGLIAICDRRYRRFRRQVEQFTEQQPVAAGAPATLSGAAQGAKG